MAQSAMVLMIVILSLVWGGFVLTLRKAIKKESQKVRDGS